MPYSGACFFASSRQIKISPLLVPVTYERTFGTYVLLRKVEFTAFAFAFVTYTSETSHFGRT